MTTIITSDPVPPLPPERPRRADDGKKWFDPTINLGHILTIGALGISMLVAWNGMDKRVLVLEVAQASQREKDAAQDSANKEGLMQVKEALVEVKRSVEKLGDKVENKK